MRPEALHRWLMRRKAPRGELVFEGVMYALFVVAIVAVVAFSALPAIR